jgi:hypothetical protein
MNRVGRSVSSESNAESTTGVTRRQLLATVGTASLAGLAGCSSTVGSAGDEIQTTTPVPESATSSDPGPGTPDDVVAHGLPASLCSKPPIPDVGIRAVVEPAYGPHWNDIEVPERYRFGFEVGTGLRADSFVVGVERGGSARAYPLSVLWWHEAVNDELGGALLVTYCPICRSGMVADRTVDGVPAQFVVSGHLWQPPRIYAEASALDGRTFGASATEGDVAVRNSGNLVLVDDRTESYWSQLLARAVCGPQSGEKLEIVPSTVTTWSEWRSRHPETDVLLPPPHSGVV